MVTIVSYGDIVNIIVPCLTECTSPWCRAGNAVRQLSGCRLTHSLSVSPLRTTFSIRCGAGTVGDWTEWPGGWHCPVILKPTTGQMVFFWTAGSWGRHPQPHWSGITVDGGPPSWQILCFLFFGHASISVALSTTEFSWHHTYKDPRIQDRPPVPRHQPQDLLGQTQTWLS